MLKKVLAVIKMKGENITYIIINTTHSMASDCKFYYKRSLNLCI